MAELGGEVVERAPGEPLGDAQPELGHGGLLGQAALEVGAGGVARRGVLEDDDGARDTAVGQLERRGLHGEAHAVARRDVHALPRPAGERGDAAVADRPGGGREGLGGQAPDQGVGVVAARGGQRAREHDDAQVGVDHEHARLGQRAREGAGDRPRLREEGRARQRLHEAIGPAAGHFSGHETLIGAFALLLEAGASVTVRAMAAEVLSDRALNRALLARQLLLERHAMGSAEAIEHLVGLQAQAPNAPYVGLWSRLAPFDPADLAGLLERRAAIRTHVMRTTVHLVTARDGALLRPLMQPVLDRSFASSPWAKKLPGVDLDAVAAAGRELLAGAVLTRAQLGERLAERFPGQDPASLAHAVTIRVPAVQVPPRGIWGASGPAAWAADRGVDGRAAGGRARRRRRGAALPRRLRACEHPRRADLVGPDAPARRDRAPPPPAADLPRRARARALRPARRAAPRPPTCPRRRASCPSTTTCCSPTPTARASTATAASCPCPRATAACGAPCSSTGSSARLWRVEREGPVATVRVEPFGRLTRAERAAVIAEGERLAAFTAPDAERHGAAVA